jgi:hypothetical protein
MSTLQELLKQIAPLPWRATFDPIGKVIEPSKFVRGVSYVATLDNRGISDGTLDLHAAYLTHAANVLPEVVREMECLIGKLEWLLEHQDPYQPPTTDDWAGIESAINGAHAAIAKANTIEM